MLTSLVQKLIAVSITIIFVAYLGYGLYNKSTEGVVLNESIEAETTSEDVVALVTKLKDLKIDKTIFSNEAFLSLVDFSSIISPEEQGRPNPFAPIGAEDGTYRAPKTQTASRP